MLMNAVNRCMFISWFAFGCHLGRPPTTDDTFKVGRVVTLGAEAGLKDSLRNGLATAFSLRALSGVDAAQPVNVAVLSATVQPRGVGPSSQIFAATLTVSVVAGRRASRFSAERSYTVIDPVQGAAARAEAFNSLAHGLMADAVMWLAHGPTVDD